MTDDTRGAMRSMRWGALLGVLTLVYGFGLGGSFGAFEDQLKGVLNARGEAALAEAYDGDQGAMKKVTAKAWIYMKRAHLHANGLGAATLGLILLLAHLPRGRRIRPFIALALGLGSLGYGLFWELAALRAPGLGSTGTAKETLDWLAIPSSGLLLLGLGAVLGVVALSFLAPGRESGSTA